MEKHLEARCPPRCAHPSPPHVLRARRAPLSPQVSALQTLVQSRPPASLTPDSGAPRRQPEAEGAPARGARATPQPASAPSASSGPLSRQRSTLRVLATNAQIERSRLLSARASSPCAKPVGVSLSAQLLSATELRSSPHDDARRSSAGSTDVVQR